MKIIVSNICPSPLFLSAGLLLFACNDGATQSVEHGAKPKRSEAELEPVDSGARLRVELPFRAIAGGKTVTCGNKLSLGSSPTEVELLDLRFYISNLSLVDARGAVVPVELDANDFQSNGVTLIDLENGEDACAGSGNAQLNSVIVGSVPAGDYQAVHFSLGLPFELNHVNASTAESPLNIQNLFWNWLPGHKFMRADVRPVALLDGGAPAPWNFHLGSTMCTQDLAKDEVPNPQAPPKGPCGRPNLPDYKLTDFALATSGVVVDLSHLFSGSDISVNLGGATPGCMSFPPDEPDCTQVFSALGLEYKTGNCVDDCEGQTVFSLE